MITRSLKVFALLVLAFATGPLLVELITPRPALAQTTSGSGVTAGTYTNATITVSKSGLVTAASSGGVTFNVTGTGYPASTINFNGPFSGGIQTTTMGVTFTGSLPAPVNLIVERGGANQLMIRADEVALADSSFGVTVTRNVSVTCNIAASVGFNGPDASGCDDEGWKYGWLVLKTDGTLGTVVSESATGPAMPASCLWKRLVTAAYNHSDNNFLGYVQHGRVVTWDLAANVVVASGGGRVANGISSTTFAAQDCSKRIPVAISRDIRINMWIVSDASARNLEIRTTGLATMDFFLVGIANASVLHPVALAVDSSGQYDYKVSNAAAQHYSDVTGYVITIW